MKSKVKEADKKESSVTVNARPLTVNKVEQITFRLKNSKVINIDANLKRIYSITN